MTNVADFGVVSLFGGPTGERQVSAACVETLEELLVRARSGEIIGVACACLHHDRLGSYLVGGMIGDYALLGALDCAKSEIVDLVRSE